MNDAAPSISVIIPWWDHGDLLRLWDQNLRFLAGAEVIFVDNGSAAVTRDQLAEFCRRSGVRLIRNENNRGFSAANNQGAEAARGDYLLFLNNDVQIRQPFLEMLMARAGQGVAGPGPLINELYEVYLEGWCLCIRRDALLKLGGWAERYTLGYWDDVDLCHRARKAGMVLTPVPEIHQLIHHLGNTTGRDGRIDQIALHIKNRGLFAGVHYGQKPKIVIDGVFFQLYQTGIARVWRSLLEQWAKTEFAQHLVVLDRASSAPRIEGIRYRGMEPFDYAKMERDRQVLQIICDEENADAFVSTYYTTPLSTPSLFMCHDMIPELFGWDLKHPMWRQKHEAIERASGFVCVSQASRQDLLKLFPRIDPAKVAVTPLAAARCFYSRSTEEVNFVREATGTTRPYFLTVGARGGYKNTQLTFAALAQFDRLAEFDLFCAGLTTLEEEYQRVVPGKEVKAFNLTDDELAAAYSGAVALLHPSSYEGFGLPVLEAMACGCPVITTRGGSLAEVAGDAAIFVEPDDVTGMTAALHEVLRPDVRRRMAQAGLEQAKKFSWEKTADGVRHALLNMIQSRK